VVAGAAKLVGKKVTALVGRALQGTAYATPAEDVVMQSPITFEAEAERPMRAPSRKKPLDEPEATSSPEVSVEALGEVGSEVDEVVEDVAEETPALEGEPQADVPEDGQPKKKRTRRGTRGGRGRKKTPAAADGGAEVSTTGEPTVDGAATDVRAQQPKPRAKPKPKPRPPKIHVPPSEHEAEEDADVAATAVTPEPDLAVGVAADGDVLTASGVAGEGEVSADGQPKRKRSRRGSRGGRKRRKPAANGDQGDSDRAAVAAEPAVSVSVADTDAEPAAEPAASADDATPEYVPMSEWIGDFDSRSQRS
jgi:hypothetical protein